MPSSKKGRRSQQPQAKELQHHASHFASHRAADKKEGQDAMTQKDRAAAWLLDRQIDLPLYALLALFISHALSGTSSLSLAHLSAKLPHSLQVLLPTWARNLPWLAPFASELPNASRGSKGGLLSSHHSFSNGGPASSTAAAAAAAASYAGPFRSDAAGFGHPLTALHSFTRACLGLSYAERTTTGVIRDFARAPSSIFHSSAHPEPWTWLVGERDTTYAKGPKDLLFVLTWVLIFTALRAVVIKHLLVPMGQALVPRKAGRSEATATTLAQANKARLKARRAWGKEVQRFAEQGWNVLFYLVSWSMGMYIAYHSSYWFRTDMLWEDWPVYRLDGLTKLYYLAQCGFWLQQVFVLNVEARRKDHVQMFSHHIITILLLAGSYLGHFTRVGNAVLVLMDPSDILLSLAKCLRYVGLQTACDVGFGAFMLSWILTRHVLYNIVLYSCWREAAHPAHPELAYLAPRTTFSPGEPGRWALVGLLGALQFILCIWFVMIVRVAWKVVTGKGAEDTRSDEESDEEEQEKELERKVDEAAERETERETEWRKAAQGKGGSAKPSPTAKDTMSSSGISAATNHSSRRRGR